MTKFTPQRFMYEIFEDIAASENRAEAAAKLKNYNKNLPAKESLALRDVIKGALDPYIVWRLPTTRPTFKLSEEFSAPRTLFNETSKFIYLVDGSRQSIQDNNKRMKMYLGILESIPPKEAEIVIGMVQKKIDYKHMTPTTVRMAFGDSFFEEDKKAKREGREVTVEKS